MLSKMRFSSARMTCVSRVRPAAGRACVHEGKGKLCLRGAVAQHQADGGLRNAERGGGLGNGPVHADGADDLQLADGERHSVLLRIRRAYVEISRPQLILSTRLLFWSAKPGAREKAGRGAPAARSHERGCSWDGPPAARRATRRQHGEPHEVRRSEHRVRRLRSRCRCPSTWAAVPGFRRGALWDRLDVLLVRVETEDGLVGWGEASATPPSRPRAPRWTPSWRRW